MSIEKYKVKPVNDIFTVWKIPFADIESAGLSLKDKNDTYSVKRHGEEKGWDIAINAGMFSNGPKDSDPFYYWNISDMIIGGEINNEGNYSSTGIAFGDPWEGISAYKSTTRNSMGNKVDFIGGSPTLVLDGKPNMDTKGLTQTFATMKTNRTAVGVNASHLIFLVTKEKHANLVQVQTEMLRQGCTNAINVDGGRSTGVWTKDGSDIYLGRNVTSSMGLKLKSSKGSVTKPKTKWIQDAGHGGTDPGSVYPGRTEKFYTLEAALHVRDRLLQHGIPSDITRTKDEYLSVAKRVDMVAKYERCVSHHFNASVKPMTAVGLEIIKSIYSDGKFEDVLLDEFKKTDVPIRPRPIYTRTLDNNPKVDYYYMHRETGKCRVSILEYDFVNGPTREIEDPEYRKVMYETTVKAICRFEGVTYIPPGGQEPPKEELQTDVWYKVQLDAFRVKKNAEKLKAKLELEGYKPIIVTEK